MRENGDERERSVVFQAYNQREGRSIGGYGFSVKESEQRQVDRLYMLAKTIAAALGVSLEMNWYGDWK